MTNYQKAIKVRKVCETKEACNTCIYYNNCKKVRTNSEVSEREKHILNRLPKLYLKKGRFVCY